MININKQANPRGWLLLALAFTINFACGALAAMYQLNII